MRRVVTKLRSLPQIEQDVLTLCAWEDLTPKEASDSPSVPPEVRPCELACTEHDMGLRVRTRRPGTRQSQ